MACFVYLFTMIAGDATKRYLFFPERIAPKCIFDVFQAFVYFALATIIATFFREKVEEEEKL